MPPKGYVLKTLEERFNSSYWVNPNGCWIWLKSLRNGYGVIGDQGSRKILYAHRYSYERKYGPIPEGKVLDHFYCHTPSCCNPDHVEPVLQAENLRRGDAPNMKTHREGICKNGHILNEANTYTRPSGRVTCAICSRLRTEKRRTTNKGQIPTIWGVQ